MGKIGKIHGYVLIIAFTLGFGLLIGLMFSTAIKTTMRVISENDFTYMLFYALITGVNLLLISYLLHLFHIILVEGRVEEIIGD